ncbi:hypothetical protein HK101_011739 [Irineochytrium annulatum]|nr:hypothetical protein HK101_011739 [Irineochytrium annulatum]
MVDIDNDPASIAPAVALKSSWRAAILRPLATASIVFAHNAVHVLLIMSALLALMLACLAIERVAAAADNVTSAVGIVRSFSNPVVLWWIVFDGMMELVIAGMNAADLAHVVRSNAGCGVFGSGKGEANVPRCFKAVAREYFAAGLNRRHFLVLGLKFCVFFAVGLAGLGATAFAVAVPVSGFPACCLAHLLIPAEKGTGLMKRVMDGFKAGLIGTVGGFLIMWTPAIPMLATTVFYPRISEDGTRVIKTVLFFTLKFAFAAVSQQFFQSTLAQSISSPDLSAAIKRSANALQATHDAHLASLRLDSLRLDRPAQNCLAQRSIMGSGLIVAQLEISYWFSLLRQFQTGPLFAAGALVSIALDLAQRCVILALRRRSILAVYATLGKGADPQPRSVWDVVVSPPSQSRKDLGASLGKVHPEEIGGKSKTHGHDMMGFRSAVMMAPELDGSADSLTNPPLSPPPAFIDQQIEEGAPLPPPPPAASQVKSGSEKLAEIWMLEVKMIFTRLPSLQRKYLQQAGYNVVDMTGAAIVILIATSLTILFGSTDALATVTPACAATLPLTIAMALKRGLTLLALRVGSDAVYIACADRVRVPLRAASRMRLPIITAVVVTAFTFASSCMVLAIFRGAVNEIGVGLDTVPCELVRY